MKKYYKIDTEKIEKDHGTLGKYMKLKNFPSRNSILYTLKKEQNRTISSNNKMMPFIDDVYLIESDNPSYGAGAKPLQKYTINMKLLIEEGITKQELYAKCNISRSQLATGAAGFTERSLAYQAIPSKYLIELEEVNFPTNNSHKKMYYRISQKAIEKLGRKEYAEKYNIGMGYTHMSFSKTSKLYKSVPKEDIVEYGMGTRMEKLKETKSWFLINKQLVEKDMTQTALSRFLGISIDRVVRGAKKPFAVQSQVYKELKSKYPQYLMEVDNEGVSIISTDDV